MEPRKIYCPNCYNPIENDSKECPRCFTIISHNLENFLLAKYKIFTLIGVFGALSIYLLTTSNQNGGDPLLLSGSLFSLTLVIILSGICIWDLLTYFSTKNEKIDYQNLSIGDIFRKIRSLPSFILFSVFFSALIFILALFVLSNKAANYSIISTVFLTVVAIIFISIVYYPYRYFIEKMNNWIRAIIFVFLLYALFSFIQTQILKLPFEPISISLTAIVSLILIILLGRCLQLMYRDMTSEKSGLTMDTTPDTQDEDNKEITENKKTDPTENQNKKSGGKEKIAVAFALVIIGVFLNFVLILVFGINHRYTYRLDMDFIF
jgi:hypothetical protein